MSPEERENAVIDAALRLAATRPWREIRLADIALEAGTDLAGLARAVDGKADILRRFARRTDRLLLESLKDTPVSGDAHDRLFETIMRRLEIMAPHRAAVASLMSAPPRGADDLSILFSSMFRSQAWMLASAGLEADGVQGTLRLNGLALVYARTLRTWVDDTDAGQAKTMAVLDRALRDGADWLKRAEAPVALGQAVAGLLRGFLRPRRPPEAPSPTETPAAPV